MLDKKIIEDVIELVENRENQDRTPKNLVQVKFEDGTLLVYFSDLNEIKIGDVVFVEGKMKGKIAVVTKVLSSFKKPRFNMQWIGGVIDNDITGKYFRLDEDVLSFQSNLTIDKFISIYVGEKFEPNQAFGDDDISIDLEKLEQCELFSDEGVKQRGYQLYKNGYVAYLSLNEGVGKAVVRSASGDEWYQLDYKYANGKVTMLTCDCPYFDACKHSYAVLLKLKDVLKKLSNKTVTENFVACRKYCFNYIMLFGKGRVELEL